MKFIMRLIIIILIVIVFFTQGCKGSEKTQIDESDSITGFSNSEKIDYRFNDLNKLGIDSILIELNYPKYGEIFLSAQNSYYQKNDIFGHMLYPKYTIDEDSWKILINGINKYVILKEPFLIKKVKRSDGLIAEVDYFARLYIYIYIRNNVLSSEIEKTEEVGKYIYIYTDDFKKWYEYIYSLLYY